VEGSLVKRFLRNEDFLLSLVGCEGVRFAAEADEDGEVDEHESRVGLRGEEKLATERPDDRGPLPMSDRGVAAVVLVTAVLVVRAVLMVLVDCHGLIERPSSWEENCCAREDSGDLWSDGAAMMTRIVG
jgi:hypothetical protein